MYHVDILICHQLNSIIFILSFFQYCQTFLHIMPISHKIHLTYEKLEYILKKKLTRASVQQVYVATSSHTGQAVPILWKLLLLLSVENLLL